MTTRYYVWIRLALTACFMAAIGCTNQTDSTRPLLADVELFRLHCSSCHGDGSGNGHIAPTLKVRPRNLKLPEWQSSVNDGHIYRVIREGGSAVKLSAEMPNFRSKLNDDEIEVLVSFVRSLAK